MDFCYCPPTETFPIDTVGETSAVRETCGSVALHGQGPEEGKEPGALRAGFLEEEEHFRAVGRGCGGWAWGEQPFRRGQNWCLLVAKPRTLPVSIRPNLNFADSTSHFPWSCEKHSMTFIQSEQLYSSGPPDSPGQTGLPLPPPPATRTCQAGTHTHDKATRLCSHAHGVSTGVQRLRSRSHTRVPSCVTCAYTGAPYPWPCLRVHACVLGGAHTDTGVVCVCMHGLCAHIHTHTSIHTRISAPVGVPGAHHLPSLLARWVQALLAVPRGGGATF